MSQDWDFFFRTVEATRPGPGGLGVCAAALFVDLALREHGPEPARPWLVQVEVAMQSPRADGLGDEGESTALYALEDDLFSALARSAQARYVGRVTSEGRRVHFYYAPSDENLSEIVAEVLARHPAYPGTTTVRHDPYWDEYRERLAPNLVEYQSVLTRRTVESARDAGDELNRPRPIHHWLDFPSAQSREQFLAQVRGQGFAITEPDLEEAHSPELPYTAQLSRQDTLQLEFLDGLVTDLVIRGEDSGGQYRGWASE
jgi:hypothetical protein